MRRLRSRRELNGGKRPVGIWWLIVVIVVQTKDGDEDRDFQRTEAREGGDGSKKQEGVSNTSNTKTSESPSQLESGPLESPDLSLVLVQQLRPACVTFSIVIYRIITWVVSTSRQRRQRFNRSSGERRSTRAWASGVELC